jgi:hypothetical protein
VWTWRWLVTYDTLFVIDLATRRVQIVGSTSYPDEAFMCQAGRTMTGTDEGALAGCSGADLRPRPEVERTSPSHAGRIGGARGA